MKIKKCPADGNYTMHDTCKCGAKILSAHPSKFSPDDKYGKYRRMAKQK